LLITVLSDVVLDPSAIEVVPAIVDDVMKPLSLVVSTLKVETKLLDCAVEGKAEGIAVDGKFVELTDDWVVSVNKGLPDVTVKLSVVCSLAAVVLDKGAIELNPFAFVVAGNKVEGPTSDSMVVPSLTKVVDWSIEPNVVEETDGELLTDRIGPLVVTDSMSNPELDPPVPAE